MIHLPEEIWSHEILSKYLPVSQWPRTTVMLRRTCHWFAKHIVVTVNLLAITIEIVALAKNNTWWKAIGWKVAIPLFPWCKKTRLFRDHVISLGSIEIFRLVIKSMKLISIDKFDMLSALRMGNVDMIKSIWSYSSENKHHSSMVDLLPRFLSAISNSDNPRIDDVYQWLFYDWAPLNSTYHGLIRIQDTMEQILLEILRRDKKKIGNSKRLLQGYVDLMDAYSVSVRLFKMKITSYCEQQKYQ